MKVIRVKNVNMALNKGIDLIKEFGVEIPSRYGSTIEIPEPVTTVYEKPWEKVLISEVRDANPFFHLMEGLWIIAGRQDVKFLTEFNKRMKEFSDDGEVFNAPYGYRLKHYFIDKSDGLDQIESVIEILSKDPNSRQVICQIWSANDLNKQTKDKACNMIIVFRIRKNKLDMTVYNRSNDMVWGTYGSNAVHFSMLHEYVSAKINTAVGYYYQVSNSFHVYTGGAGGKVWDKIKNIKFEDPYERKDIKTLVFMLPQEINLFDNDLKHFFKVYDMNTNLEDICYIIGWQSTYFKDLVIPVLRSFLSYKNNNLDLSTHYLSTVVADDWRIACEQWISNRIKRKNKKQNNKKVKN